MPADDYITFKVYAYYRGVSGTNEDSGYQHADWIDSQPTALATISGWESNPLSLSKNNTVLHSDGYLLLGTGADVVRIDATHADYRLWIGHATDPTQAAYAVEKTGCLHATGAIIEGAIEATSGLIGGWDVDATHIYKSNVGLYTTSQTPADLNIKISGFNTAIYVGAKVRLDASVTDASYIGVNATAYEGIGFFVGQSGGPSTYKMSIGAGASGSRWLWDNSARRVKYCWT